MAYAALSLLLDTLRDLQREHMNLIRGVEGELKKLQKEVEKLTAFLHEQQQKNKTTTTGEEWKQFDREIRDLVYKAEDIIDTFLSRKLRRFSPKNRNLNLRPVIDGIRNALEHAPADVSQRPKIEHLRVKNIWLKEMYVVGLEDELATLLGYLAEESKELDVISMVGEFGIGKTTLASKIYDDPRLKSTFPTLFWVNVSQDFSMKDLFISVMEDFFEETMSQLSDSMLADIVRHKLGKTKFLMFVDDIHTMEEWRAIERALPKSNKFGKVLLTTHDEKLARQANPRRDPHKLRSLNLDESWELFRLFVFGKRSRYPPELETMGKEMVSKCKGIPDAIIEMAGILRKKFSTNHEMDEWINISKTVDKYLSKNAETRMEIIIKMSYNRLPHHLRDCFLYLGMFPEDTTIPVWKLVCLWIAEGFIQKNPSKTLEQVAEEHLKDLIDRNLVMVDKTKVEGGIKTCRISKMIRDFCKSHATSDKQNLFCEFHARGGKFEMGRRLCIHSNVVDFLRIKRFDKEIRSLLCFSKEPTNFPAEGPVPEAFRLLRILDASPIRFLNFERELIKMIHLRYIAISSDELSSLPQDASKLWSLQTIIIHSKLPKFKINANIWNMLRLRHLKTKAAIVIKKVAKRKGGDSLQTLSNLAPECVAEEFCNRASNLKKLGIRGRLDNLLNGNYLSRLDHLKKMKLMHDVPVGIVPEDNPLIRLPDPEAFPPNLMILELSSTYLKWDHMATLAKLPSLEVLKLKRHAFVGKEWNADYRGFPFLEVLLIATTDLELWTTTDDHPLPALRNLVLINCDKLEEIPSQLLRRVQESKKDGNMLEATCPSLRSYRLYPISTGSFTENTLKKRNFDGDKVSY